MSPSFFRLVFMVCLGLYWGCGSRIAAHQVPLPSPAPSTSQPAGVPAGTTPIASECALISGAGEPIGVVALAERVDPAHAPSPANESERLLFRQLYETLVRVDCNGRAAPGLAASWQFDPTARSWIVTMRPNARFSDDVPVTAADVVSAWNMGTGDALRPEVRRLVRSVRGIDDRTLEISLENHGMDAPLALAHPALAVARRVSGSGWPLGTRPARITTDGNSPSPIAPAIITLVRFSADAALAGTPKDLSSVRFVVAPGRDLRDLLDERVDLLLTRDPAVLDYAATLPQFVSMPLPWQRTRVLLMPGRDRMSRALSAEERETFARDAVRGPARGALEPFWWRSMPQCEISYPQKPDALSTSGRIVYDGGDSTARDLAERLVGLVRASGPGPAAILAALLPARPRRTFQNAAGLTGEPLLLARRRGNDAGYIMSLDSRPLDSCAEMQAVVDDVGWIDPETIVPLVDTRLQAIVRRGRTGMILDWDGGLLLDGGDKR